MKEIGVRLGDGVWRAGIGRGLAALALVLVFQVAARADEPFARSRDYDLQNARIHLRFDFDQRKVLGEVTHTLAPLRDGLPRVEFDSVGLTIHTVTLRGKPAKFATTPDKLRVTLDQPARAGGRIEVTIRYEGRPKQGLYFVLPDKNYPNRPGHLWTQGETEETRHFVPIYDYPNDFTASEMLATVPRDWLTLSNGRLVGVKNERDGTRTWHWRQSQPHASYLISLVAGEFQEVKETWGKIPVTYYVLRGQRERVAPTFEHTRKMLDLFSDKLGVPYPWEKYAQIAVEEHFGGMEHTSAATLTHTFLVHPKLAGEKAHGADGLIAHELGHQWFGDLVTCKDWANLWLNEGFSSFLGVLWFEHHYGPDDAAYDLWQARNNWLANKNLYAVPILTRDFSDVIVYAGNFYTKANLVVHMLRSELGDADFFRALRHYLEKHRGQNVVAADLVAAVEEATGRNLDPFFEQWVYRAGAPRFEVSYDYEQAARQVKLTVKQTQKVEKQVGLFRVPIEVEITTPAGKQSHSITVSQASETFSFPADQRPLLVLFDKGGAILKSVEFKKDGSEWLYQLQNAETVPDRADAARALGEFKDKEEVAAGLGEAARNDRFWGVRVEALRALGKTGGPAALKQIEAALANEQPWVRRVAVEVLGNFKDDATVASRLEQIYRTDPAYTVRVTALGSLARLKAPRAGELLRAAVATESPDDSLCIAGLQGLGTLADDVALPLLLEWSAPGKPFAVRSAAISSLGKVDKKNKEVTRRLIAYLEEPYGSLRFPAILALSQRGDLEAVAPLEALLERGELSPFAVPYVRGLIARLKQPTEQKPAGTPAAAGGAPQAPPAEPPAAPAPTLGELQQKIEKLERENAELRERVKKLEERLAAAKN